MLTFILLLHYYLLVTPTNAKVLPDGFTIGIGPSGNTELVWSPPSPDQRVRVGGSRHEFRLGGGDTTREKLVLLGYPREVDGKLVLIMDDEQRGMLATSGQELEVWSSGRRGALGAPLFADGPASAQDANTNYIASNTPTVDVSPAALGTAATKRIAYSLPELQLSSPDFPVKIEIVGEVTHPETLVGQHPLVLFMHGRHTTCYKKNSGSTTIDWPCPPDLLPIPSHEGYRYIADILASQGYVVVSVSANGINGQDYAAYDGGAAARSILVRHHLALWAKWHANGGDPWSGSFFTGKLDMFNVVLVGHSRGGEGVNRAAIDASSADPFKIVGLVSYGPTAFGRQVTPDIHSITILPSCDGDVYDLQGQVYVDASRDIAYSEALRSAVTALGCNHNYFNTEWTPGLSQAEAFDDWYYDDDPVCGSNGGNIRLTPQEQQVVGATYTAALIRLAVKQDAEMLQILDGSFVRPESIVPADVAINAVGGASGRLLYRPEDDGAPTVGNGMSGGECRGYMPWDSGPGVQCGGGYFFSPHWVSFYPLPNFPAPMAMELIWMNGGAFARFNISNGKNDLSLLDWVDVRVANDPDSDNGAQLELMVLDKTGKNATVSATPSTVDGWPGSYELDRVHARTLRGGLDSVKSKVDLTNIVAVLLLARGPSGRVWVIDIAASESKLIRPVDLDLPVISLETISVPEGAGPKTVNFKVNSNKALKSPATIWLINGNEGFQVNLTAGSSTQVAQVPYSFIGDKIFTPSNFSADFAVAAIKGVVTGNYIGRLTIVEDDPIPTLSVKSKMVTAKEGKSLIWELRLSAPANGYFVDFFFVPPSKGKEISTNDIPTSWLQQFVDGMPPSTPTPLSSFQNIVVTVFFGYGNTKANLAIPIAIDGIAEDEESIVLQGVGLNGELLTLVGKVPKHK